VLFYQGSALLKRGEFQVYLEDVGHIGERLAGIVADVVIECDQVSSFFEALAGSNDSASTGTVSRISTTVECEGSSVTSPLIRVSRVQFRKARRPSHRTSRPTSNELSRVEREAASGSTL